MAACLYKLRYHIALLLCVLVAALMIHAFSGLNPLEENAFNTYSLQADAWLHGRLYLAEDHPHLELAIFQSRYYVSFPPFPSVVLLPFVLIFGINTPDTLISLLFASISALYAYKTALRFTKNESRALFLSLFLCVGSNYLHVLCWGAVWYLAQNIAFAMTMISIYYATTPKNSDSLKSLLFLACAVGCRPFQAIYLPLILILIYERYHSNEITGFIKKLAVWAIPAAAVALAYMLLNLLRFGNVFEFGHNYLPEFTGSEHGQFSLSYMSENLYRIFFLLPTPSVNGTVEFPMFEGVAFWLVSPIAITYFVSFILSMLAKNPRVTYQGDYPVGKLTLVFALILIFLHLLSFSLHKTMGGYHFGNRYTVDCLPILFLGLLGQKTYLSGKYELFNLPLLALGFGLNLVGSIICFQSY